MRLDLPRARPVYPITIPSIIVSITRSDLYNVASWGLFVHGDEGVGVEYAPYLVHVPQEPGILVQHFLLEIRDEGVRGAQERVFGCYWGGGTAFAAGGGGGVVVEGGHCDLRGGGGGSWRVTS